MDVAKVAIVGLEQQGELLLEWLISGEEPSLKVVCAVALQKGAAAHRADARGIALVDLDKLISLSHSIDIIINLSHDPKLHDDLHQALIAQGNHRTQLLSGKALELISTLQGDRFQAQVA